MVLIDFIYEGGTFMTLQELRFIVILAREKHFGKAAAACYVSQPTLSIAVRKLENKLGVALFERNKNEVKLTAQGAKIIGLANHILEEVDMLKMLARSEQDQLSGILKLGVIYTAASYILPVLIKKLNQSVPEMVLDIREDFPDNLKEKLRLGELDAIIISMPYTDTYVMTAALYREPFVALMPADHPLAQHEIITEELLMDHSLLLVGEKHCFRDQVMAVFPKYFTFKNNWRSVEGSSLETVRHMVASGMGIAILPMIAAITNLCPYGEQILTTRPLAPPNAERLLGIAWRMSFSRPKALEALIETFYQCDIPGAIK